MESLSIRTCVKMGNGNGKLIQNKSNIFSQRVLLGFGDYFQAKTQLLNMF